MNTVWGLGLTVEGLGFRDDSCISHDPNTPSPKHVNVRTAVTIVIGAFIIRLGYYTIVIPRYC